MADFREMHQVHLKNGSVISSDSPIIYSGNYVLITVKDVTSFETTATVTATTTPYHMDQVARIITNHITKKYPQYENKQ